VRYIATLSVCDHEQSRVARDGHDILECLPARRAQPFEAGELKLYGDARRPCCHDQAAAVSGDGSAGTLGGGAFARHLDRRRQQSQRVGIEAERDLALTLGYRRGEPISEISRGGPD
jgi:hypothetical protein